MPYDSPLNTLNMGPREHEEDDVPIYLCVFNKRGKIVGSDEVCSCTVGMVDLKSLPRGGYITVLEVPLQFH